MLEATDKYYYVRQHHMCGGIAVVGEIIALAAWQAKNMRVIAYLAIV